MQLCKECGTELPDEARFCLHCGAPVPPIDAVVPPVEQQGPPAPTPELDFVRPALLGGAFLGVLSTLPVIAIGNYICCMWIIGGGAIAVFLLNKQQPRRTLTFGDGAFAGVSSGLFGAMIATLLSIPIKIITAPIIAAQQDAFDKLLRDNIPDSQSAMYDLLRRMASPEISATTVLTTFIGDLIIYALFAMVGGILMVAYLNRKAAAAAGRGGNFGQGSN